MTLIVIDHCLSEQTVINNVQVNISVKSCSRASRSNRRLDGFEVELSTLHTP